MQKVDMWGDLVAEIPNRNIRDFYVDVLIFLQTHPLPVGIANAVNGCLGYGISIPAVKTERKGLARQYENH